ncbi:hypothetical protein Ddc_20052 [Ditylenchus destructor]|nr:hypothetical protein Ddc_20052 [Ditylenchus destructor]
MPWNRRGEEAADTSPQPCADTALRAAGALTLQSSLSVLAMAAMLGACGMESAAEEVPPPAPPPLVSVATLQPESLTVTETFPGPRGRAARGGDPSAGGRHRAAPAVPGGRRGARRATAVRDQRRALQGRGGRRRGGAEAGRGLAGAHAAAGGPSGPAGQGGSRQPPGL